MFQTVNGKKREGRQTWEEKISKEGSENEKGSEKTRKSERKCSMV